ncbi:hypothetical protein [Peribacillus simplex]|uniref:hypothetical protein n=1 Tax=Peribacillus simplex TaxID=1478 RepID=UPI0024C11DF3|nr:hypothetical protein [Peribacillus simplex]WHY55944.1 hypothetical protein QNH43_22830 [Peribacillus simplex]
MDICFIGGGNHTNNELVEVFLELSKMIKPEAKILISLLQPTIPGMKVGWQVSDKLFQ